MLASKSFNAIYRVAVGGILENNLENHTKKKIKVVQKIILLKATF